MHPILFKIGPLTLYSFGLMAALAFLAGNLVIEREFHRYGIARRGYSGEVILTALIGGMLGAKVYYFIEHWSEFVVDPWGMIFSGAGLVWYGGLAGGTLAVLLLIHRRRYPLGRTADALALALALGYGIGRIGCLLSGDGDYGPPTDLPWGMTFPEGIVPTTEHVHPTPIYEALMSWGIFGYLYRGRPFEARPGGLFWSYILLAGVERLIAEFWRLTPKVALGLTMAQWISLALIVISSVVLYRFKQGH
ncbi:MAG: prolipoprotein diacylglyceryl transferase [Candidatus Latescibacteria bacterium]|nr:prolipoprotein diacylglyceryl transferase [Candidatus Latescibacterota bacterium]